MYSIYLTSKNGSYKFIVFSKDRPLQLHALLKSIQHFVVGEFEIFIIYNVSNEETYGKTYLELAREFKSENIKFIKENNSFRDTLKKVLIKINKGRIFFLVDDIIFKNFINLSVLDKVNIRTCVFSLRHGTHLSHSYVVNRSQKLPFFSESSFSSEVIEWKWSLGELDWGYPLSVDGHLFDISEARFWVNNLNFKSPNTFELSLQIFKRFYFLKKGMAFRNSIILNIPCNKVQDDIQNFHGNLHQSELLNLWNNGYRIDHLSFQNILNKSVHEELEFKIIK